MRREKEQESSHKLILSVTHLIENNKLFSVYVTTSQGLYKRLPLSRYKPRKVCHRHVKIDAKNVLLSSLPRPRMVALKLPSLSGE